MSGNDTHKDRGFKFNYNGGNSHLLSSKDVLNNINNGPFVESISSSFEKNAETLMSFITDTNLEVNRKTISTFGEYLFLISV